MVLEKTENKKKLRKFIPISPTIEKFTIPRWMLVSKREQARESERASIYYLIQRDDATRYPEKLFKLTHFFLLLSVFVLLSICRVRFIFFRLKLLF